MLVRESERAAFKHRIYFDYGTETLDSLYEDLQLNIDSVMIRKGYDESLWTTRKFEGAMHDEKSWKARPHIPMEFLLGQ